MQCSTTRSARAALWSAMILALAHICACGGSPAAEPPIDTQPADPGAARLVTSDLERFWAAYDAGGRYGSATVFQAGYLDQASPGLTDFARLRTLTATSLVAMVSAYPRYFAAIRRTSLTLAGGGGPVRTTVRDNFARVKAIYPPAVFPPVTFLVGRFSTAGTISPAGVLIGAEFYGLDDSTPIDELQPFQRNNVKPLADLPVVIAHEHTHVLQARGSRLSSRPNKTLLEQALLEGSADFIGELVSGGNLNERIFSFALANERALWDEFRTEMQGTDVSRWLYNQGSESDGRPGDLGYFIGYRIAQAFYDGSADKVAAIAAIIEVSDADALLARSGYAP